LVKQKNNKALTDCNTNRKMGTTCKSHRWHQSFILCHMKVHIGTSGWSYKEWKGTFYPNELKATDWLEHYSKTFDTTEINSSFYRLPKAETVLNWVEKVPDTFTFCPKISRYLTHIKRLKEPEEPLERFFNLFAPIKEKLGPVLIQLPASVKFDYDIVGYFFGLLKKQYKGYAFALEARHDTWMENDALDLMASYDIAWVISQSGVGFPYSEMVTSGDIYVRFHGPKELYGSSYTDSQLKDFADKFKAWLKEGHTIWAYFNNTMNGIAIENALKLEELLK
jgi:uncharacterized protein YecE (DUF72 family)